MFSLNRPFRKGYCMDIYRKSAKLLSDHYIVYVTGIETITTRSAIARGI